MGENVTFASNGGTADGYLAKPSGGAGPGVIVVQEWWGLVPHIRNVADRFAEAGYVALAPDLYHGASTGEPDEAMRLMMGLAMDQAAKDMAGAGAYLDGRDDTDGHGVGIVGFCLGGSLALYAPTVSDHITAAVGFYPAVPWERMNPAWSRYQGKGAEIHTDEAEGGSQGEGVQQAVAAIQGAGGALKVYDYPGTEHAFFNDDRPEVYAPTAAKEAWQRTLAFFAHRLSGAEGPSSRPQV